MARPRSALRTILSIGFIAGTLDILDAIVFFYLRSHTPAERILQSVASGIFGRSAYSGGWPIAALGLALHYMIASAWAGIFIFLARFVPILKQHAVSAGLIFGFVVYAIMNFAVLPHTKAVPQPSHNPIVLFNAVCAIVFLVGLPVALLNRKLS